MELCIIGSVVQLVGDLCNAGVVLCNDGVVLHNVFLPCSIPLYSVIPTAPELGADWVVPHSDTLHTLIRDYRERTNM